MWSFEPFWDSIRANEGAAVGIMSPTRGFPGPHPGTPVGSFFSGTDQSQHSWCGGRMECESLYELGPPPDMILNIPPPPIPPFMAEFVNRLAAEGINIHEDDKGFPEEEKQCNLCHWANGNGVGYVELAQKGPLIDDTWFLVIISSCVAATLLGIILAIAFLKYREGKLKPLSDVALAKKEKALGLERCEAVLYPAPVPASAPQVDARTMSRALWAGIKPLEGNHYTVDHCQPMEQKPVRLDLLPPHENSYDYADYSSVSYASAGYTTLTPRLDQHSPRPAPAASFENVGYVPGDDAAEVERIAPDGCVVTAPRAARLLGSPRFAQGNNDHHHYEMVTPSPRRNRSLDRGSGRQPPIISGPTSLGPVRLPALNGRPSPRYNLTALASGAHTLTPKVENSARSERRHAHVSLDRTGSTSTSLAPASPTDHIYASPITSPVI